MEKITKSTRWLLFLVASALVLCGSCWAEHEADKTRPGTWINTTCTIWHAPPRVCTAGVSGDGCIFGIFIGMSENYGQTLLAGVDELAQGTRQAFVERGLMRPEDGIVLTSREATVGRVLAAFRQLRPRIRPQDVFVFSFDGHGDVGELCLWRSRLSRRMLASELSRLAAIQRLLVLNGCYSGSFAGMGQVRGGRRTTVLYSSPRNRTTMGDELNSSFRLSAWNLGSNGLVTGADLEAWVRYRRYGLSSLGNYSQPIGAAGDRGATLWRAWPTPPGVYPVCPH